MKRYIVLSFVALLFFSCGGKYEYPGDIKLSNKNGAILDSTASFLPSQFEVNGHNYTFDWNKDALNQINSYFSLTSEPLLYNFYLNRDIYRLVLDEQDQNPLIISINKQGDKSWIVSKKIDPSFFEIDKTIPDSIPSLEVLSAQFKNYSRELSQDEVHSFDSIFQASNFFELENNEVNKYHNSFYLLEVHKKDNYWYVYRSSDDQPLKQVATYMRSLTGF